MALVGLTREDEVSTRVSIYMMGFIVVQLVVIIITFEFMRQPWEGKEVEFEKILQL